MEFPGSLGSIYHLPLIVLANWMIICYQTHLLREPGFTPLIRWAFWPACGPLRSFWLRTLDISMIFWSTGWTAVNGVLTSKVTRRIPWEDCRFYWSIIFLNCMGSMSGKRYNNFIDPMGLEWVVIYSTIFSIRVLVTFQGRSVEFGRCTVTLVFWTPSRSLAGSDAKDW